MTILFEYRVLVCGGRHYSKWPRVEAALNTVWMNSVGVLVVIEGGATGADQAAAEWAEKYAAFGVEHLQFPAYWRVNGRYNPHAGTQRNTQMIEEGKPDLVMAFPGGRGTRNMVRQARDYQIPVIGGEALDEVREMMGASSGEF